MFAFHDCCAVILIGFFAGRGTISRLLAFLVTNAFGHCPITAISGGDVKIHIRSCTTLTATKVVSYSLLFTKSAVSFSFPFSTFKP